ncbi:MAG TPA: pitrilysin family protein [Chthoniobacterales bacterium]|nr:pitrilysin family protein [Chthoniobacterales bacterium]
MRPAVFVIAILSVFSVAFSHGEDSPAPKAVTVPAIDFKHFTLPNGLEVYTVEDHSAPIVAVQVWYHVGSKDDPAGRSGFAHLFEHMMFKGNEHMSPDMFDNLTENIGGENNAYTADDVTVYHETVPSNYLNPILWAEAERMSALALNDKNFASERDVVKEEYRQRIRANPYGEFYFNIEKKSFAIHPYKRPGIGSIEELDASKLPEVKAFHSTFYRPDNATLVVVGDFNPAELEGWVKKYFGAVAKPSTKIPRVTVKEPPRKADKRETTYSPRAPLPAVAITYLAPSIRSNDSPALSLVGEIMAGGDSSRLYEKMVYEQQVVQSVSCDSDLREDLGLLAIRLILASGKTISEAEKSLNKEIDDVLKNGVTEAELDKAKSRFLTGKLEERETVNGKAGALGQAVVMYGDANRVNTDLAKLQAVTTAEIKDVMNRYITGKKKVVVEYLPETMKPGFVPPPSEKKEPKP